MLTDRCPIARCLPAFAVTLVALTLLWTAPASANPKYAGFVMDANTGKTLYADNADAKRFPASLTKVMTLYLVFDELKAGRLRLDTGMVVSKYASQRPPSKLGLKIGSQLKVRDAIKALVTKSANDAATVIAEHIAGSEAAFAKRMTAKARELGMASTTYKNPHGLPNRHQITTARDQARLGLAIQRDHPEYYGVFQTRSFRFGQKTFRNHNRLLGRVKGVDGIKTGYIRASGFNLTTSVRRDGKHMIAVVMGGRTGKSRNAHMTDLVGRYLPKAKRGDPLPLLAWTGRDQAPLPRSKPAELIMVASLNRTEPDPIAEHVMAFAAEARQTIATPPLASGALNAVIAQASGADIAPAPQVASKSTTELDRSTIGETTVAANASPALPVRVASLQSPSVIPGDRRLDNAFELTANAASGDPVAKIILAAERRWAAPDRAETGWQIQIGALPTQESAVNALANARASRADLADKTPVTLKIDTPEGSLYRARLAGFQSQSDAEAACAAFNAPQAVCWVVPN